MIKQRYVSKAQLEFLVEYGYINGVDPSLIQQKYNILIYTSCNSFTSTLECRVRTRKVEQLGTADRFNDLTTMNLDAALAFISEFGERVKDITDLKCSATREFFASHLPTTALKALMESDKSKSYLKEVIDPAPSFELTR